MERVKTAPFLTTNKPDDDLFHRPAAAFPVLTAWQEWYFASGVVNWNFQISLCKQPLNLHHQLQFPDGC